MKRTLMTLAAAAGLALTAQSARADWGGFSPPPSQAGGGYPVPSASSEFNAPNTLMGLGAPTPGKAPDRYGFLPGLRRAVYGCDVCGGRGGHFAGCSKSGGGLFGHHHGDCGPGGCGQGGGCGPFGLLGKHGHGGYGPGYGAPGYGAGGYGDPYGMMMQGTLVFPHHTYVRSPRDYFMYEPGR
jgi:hypothetical protein